ERQADTEERIPARLVVNLIGEVALFQRHLVAVERFHKADAVLFRGAVDCAVFEGHFEPLASDDDALHAPLLDEAHDTVQRDFLRGIDPAAEEKLQAEDNGENSQYPGPCRDRRTGIGSIIHGRLLSFHTLTRAFRYRQPRPPPARIPGSMKRGKLNSARL